MKSWLGALALVGASLLAGCFDNEESSIRQGVANYLADKKFCTNLQLSKEADSYWSYLGERYQKTLMVLENEKLIEVGKAIKGMLNDHYAYVRILSPLKGYTQNELNSNGLFCFGKLELVSIEKYTKPAANGMGRIVPSVTYLYKLKNAPEWTFRDNVRSVFPELDKALSSGLTYKIKLVQTNKMWEYIQY